MTILVLVILKDDYRFDKIETTFHRISFFIASLFAIFSVIYWYFSASSSFNLSFIDILWELLALFIVSFYMGLLILDHKNSSGLSKTLFIILFIGIIFHSIFNSNDVYSGPLRITQMIVLAAFPAILSQSSKTGKEEISIEPEFLDIGNDKGLIETKPQEKLSETELAYIWMEFATDLMDNPLPKLIRAISLSFHQDLVLYCSIPDDSNQISILAGYNVMNDEFISSGKITLPKDSNFNFFSGNSNPQIISKFGDDHQFLYEKFYDVLKLENLENFVIIPLENKNQTFGFLIFSSTMDKQLSSNFNSEYYSRIAHLTSKIITSLYEQELPKNNLSISPINPSFSNSTNPSSLDNVTLPVINTNKIAEQPDKTHNLGTAQSKELITMIVQELRQPLSSILGYTDLMLSESSGVIGPLQQKFLEKIKISNERMRNLLEELIRVTSIGERKPFLNNEVLKFDEIIGLAIDDNQNLISEKKIILRISIDPGVPDLALERKTIQQIMDNMINHAVSRSVDGGIMNVEINLKESDMEEKYLLTLIENSGEEYQEDQFRDISSKEYKLESAATKWVSNFGLNLAITKNLIEAMGGRIWIEPIIGLGNRYSFLLPIQNLLNHAGISAG